MLISASSCYVSADTSYARYVLVVLVHLFPLFFFFFKQKTAYEMRISDWSSDVCSSDLVGRYRLHLPRASDAQRGDQGSRDGGDGQADPHQIGRASCRERVCQYV